MVSGDWFRNKDKGDRRPIAGKHYQYFDILKRQAKKALWVLLFFC